MLEAIGNALKKATEKIASAIFVDKTLVDSVVKELQRALISADVNVSLVKELSDKIKKTKNKYGVLIFHFFIPNPAPS